MEAIYAQREFFQERFLKEIGGDPHGQNTFDPMGSHGPPGVRAVHARNRDERDAVALGSRAHRDCTRRIRDHGDQAGPPRAAPKDVPEHVLPPVAAAQVDDGLTGELLGGGFHHGDLRPPARVRAAPPAALVPGNDPGRY